MRDDAGCRLPPPGRASTAVARKSNETRSIAIFIVRLTCPVGHNGLLFILGESTRPRGFYPRFTFLAATALPDPYSDCYSRIYRRHPSFERSWLCP